MKITPRISRFFCSRRSTASCCCFRADEGFFLVCVAVVAFFPEFFRGLLAIPPSPQAVVRRQTLFNIVLFSTLFTYYHYTTFFAFAKARCPLSLFSLTAFLSKYTIDTKFKMFTWRYLVSKNFRTLQEKKNEMQILSFGNSRYRDDLSHLLSPTISNG